MTTLRSVLTQLSDEAVLARVDALAAGERQATSELIASLGELDARRLYLGAGCSSLFTYCTQVLHLSEHAAYGRIEAARAARRFPVILDKLEDGSLTLTAVCLLSPVLTEENRRQLLDEARHKTKREVERLVARVRPQSPVPAAIRKVPARPPAMTPPPASQPQPARVDLIGGHPMPAGSVTTRPVIAPLAPERYKVQFTLSAAGHDKLRRAQNLLRHAVPNGDPAAIFERALALLVEDLERRKLALVANPRHDPSLTARTRHIPAAVRREVWKRDGEQCAFVGSKGRCTERGFLEFHHVVPFADGGETTASNIQLRCAAHNGYEAERWFGEPDVVRESPASYG